MKARDRRKPFKTTLDPDILENLRDTVKVRKGRGGQGGRFIDVALRVLLSLMGRNNTREVADKVKKEFDAPTRRKIKRNIDKLKKDL